MVYNRGGVVKQYQDLLTNILENGTWQNNRTGIRTKMIPGAMIKFDMADGFPAMTTKKLAFKQVIGELLGFLRGADTLEQFNKLGCTVWDANGKADAWTMSDEFCSVDKAGYLGRIYGVQWSNWNGELDQIQKLLRDIRKNPTSRRMIVTAWNPTELDRMALPPCHYSFQVIIEQESGKMHLLWNQRSVDTFLGLPFNIASYATLLHILAKMTGYIPGTLTGFLADVHIYENHLDQVNEQLSRVPGKLPELDIKDDSAWVWLSDMNIIDDLEPNDFALVNYYPQSSIKAEMAV